MKFCGRDFRVGHWDGVTFTPISGERSSGISIGNEAVDTSGKSTAQWRELANCGLRTLDVSLDGIITEHATYTLMLTRSMAGSIDRYKVVSGSGESFDFYAQVLAHERSGDHNGSEAYALSLSSTGGVTYLPPDLNSATWAVAPAVDGSGLLSLWSQAKATGTWSTRGNRIDGEMFFYHRGARLWFIASIAGLWRGPNDIGAVVASNQPGWVQLDNSDYQQPHYASQYARRFLNLANGKLLITRSDGYITTIDATGAIESTSPPPHLSAVYSTLYEANGVTFYSVGNYQGGSPNPKLYFSANPSSGSWTTVNIAQFPGWYFLIGITWHAASSTFRLIVSVAAGALGGVAMQYVYSSPDGATWTEIVSGRNGLTLANCQSTVINDTIIVISNNGSQSRFAASTDGGSTWTNSLTVNISDFPSVLLPDPITLGDIWSTGTVTGGYGMVRYRLSGVTVTRVGEYLMHATINVSPQASTAQAW